MTISVLDRVENIVGKRRNCVYKEFLLFLPCFQKASIPDLSKGVIVWERVNKRYDTKYHFLHQSNDSDNDRAITIPGLTLQIKAS